MEHIFIGTAHGTKHSALLQNENEFGNHTLLETPQCVKTGFPALDQLLGGGLSPGLTVLGASPGLGKSTLALNIAEYACPLQVLWRDSIFLISSLGQTFYKVPVQIDSFKESGSPGKLRPR